MVSLIVFNYLLLYLKTVIVLTKNENRSVTACMKVNILFRLGALSHVCYPVISMIEEAVKDVCYTVLSINKILKLRFLENILDYQIVTCQLLKH